MVYHVLVAEDEEITRDAVCAGLSVLLPGAVVHGVKNGVEAVRCAERQEISLAFLDIRMPEMNGIAAAQKIRKMQPDAQLVFLTAYGDFEYVRSALKLDAVDYLLKPFDEGTLADAVQKVLKRMEAGEGGEPETWGEPDLMQDRISGWLEEPAIEELLAGRLSPARIPAGTCGCVVALTGVEDGHMHRLRHMLTGLEPGGDIRCLAGRKGRYLFVAAWSMVQDTLQEQMKKQMDLLAARLGRQFGIRLRCGISGIFFDDGDIPEACLNAFCQIPIETGQEQVRVSRHVMQGELTDALADGGISGLNGTDMEDLCALFPSAAEELAICRTETG